MNVERYISQEFLKSRPSEAARVLEAADPESAAALLDEMEGAAAVAVLQNLESWSGSRCLLRWPEGRRRFVLEALPAPHAARMLRLMEPADRERMLSLVSKPVSRTLRALLQHPDGSAASLMNPHVLAYPQDRKVEEVWKLLRRRQHPGFYVYVVDPGGVLVGALSLGDVISAKPRDTLASVMRAPVESLIADAQRETILQHPGWRRFPELPVVDETGILLGIMQHTDFRELELERRGEQPWAVWRGALALGELYWAGSSRILRELAETMGSASTPTLTEEKRHDR